MEVMPKTRKGRVRIISGLAGMKGHKVYTGEIQYGSLGVSSTV